MKKDDEFNINLHEKTIYSQNGEDGIIEFIFSKIGTTNKFFVEFGVGDGFECNTVYLLEKKGWKGLMMDYRSDEKKGLKILMRKVWFKYLKKELKDGIRRRYKHFQFGIKKEKVTAENVQNLFQKYNVPKNFDLLSIDIDFNDYWVWQAITDYYPRVVVIEYNGTLSFTDSKVVRYDPDAMGDGTDYFGASLLALQNLGSMKGYTLVGCDNFGVNAFFCKSELINGIKIKNIQDLYIPLHVDYTASDKKMIEI